jgi:phosphoribosylamine--glycine ligase
MMRLGGSVTQLLMAAARGTLADARVEWDAPAAMTVVLASRGYPGTYARGQAIAGLAEAAALAGVQVFHAGTAADGSAVRTAGGRVLAVTASGDTVDQCAERAYRAADLIHFDGKQCRRDIGHHARSRP